MPASNHPALTWELPPPGGAAADVGAAPGAGAPAAADAGAMLAMPGYSKKAANAETAEADGDDAVAKMENAAAKAAAKPMKTKGAKPTPVDNEDEEAENAWEDEEEHDDEEDTSMKRPAGAYIKKPGAAKSSVGKVAPVLARPAGAEKRLTPKEIVAAVTEWDLGIVGGKKRKFWTDKCDGKAQKLAGKNGYNEDKCKEIARMALKKASQDFDANVV